MTTAQLPRLLDRKAIAEELGITLHSAERIMRHCPKITVGRRVFVRAEAVAAYLKKAESS